MAIQTHTIAKVVQARKSFGSSVDFLASAQSKTGTAGIAKRAPYAQM
jgi:hypothetical protein